MLLIGKDVIVEGVIGSEGKEGVWIVPCISRIARPDGVWRRVGRGLVVLEREVGERWSGIDGMVLSMRLLRLLQLVWL